jgi:hypothetical protein
MVKSHKASSKPEGYPRYRLNLQISCIIRIGSDACGRAANSAPHSVANSGLTLTEWHGFNHSHRYRHINAYRPGFSEIAVTLGYSHTCRKQPKSSTGSFDFAQDDAALENPAGG